MGKITRLSSPRAVGVHWIYAPDADVNNNPGNPIINTPVPSAKTRSVSPNLWVSFVRGVQENGGLATAKHFSRATADTAADSPH